MELGCKRIIPAIKRSVSLPIIADLKVAGIPEIPTQIVQKAIRWSADGIRIFNAPSPREEAKKFAEKLAEIRNRLPSVRA